MKRLLIVALTVTMLAAMALPALAAEQAQVKSQTQAQTCDSEACGDGTQTQVQAQVQTQTQAQTCDGEACGDGTQTQVQAQVRAQAQAQIGQAEDEVTASGDQLQTGDKLQIKDQQQLMDGSCDGTPDQTQDRIGQDDETSVVAESDGTPDGWLAKLLYQFMEAFKFMFGRV